jgi:hypothetical protein
MIVSNRYTRDDPDPCKGERSSPGLDERLTAEIKGLTARVADREFTSRGILISKNKFRTILRRFSDH